MIEYAQILGIFASLIIAFITVTDKMIIKRLKNAGSFDPEEAIAFKSPSRLKRWRLWRLQRIGVVCKVKPNSYYFNKNAFTALRKNRLKRAIVIVPLIVIIVVIVSILNK